MKIFPTNSAQFSPREPGPVTMEIPGMLVYGTTCFVWNKGRTLSEKYFPISFECMRSLYTFGGTPEYWYTSPVWNSISRIFVVSSYPTERRIRDFTGCLSTIIIILLHVCWRVNGIYHYSESCSKAPDTPAGWFVRCPGGIFRLPGKNAGGPLFWQITGWSSA